MRVGATSYWYLADGLGSIIGLVDSSAARVATYTYDPNGLQLTATGAQAANNPWRFAAGSADSTGLVKFGTRYYDPSIGRWTQLDTSGQDAHYLYAGNSPTNYVDLTGLWFGEGVASGVVDTVKDAADTVSDAAQSLVGRCANGVSHIGGAIAGFGLFAAPWELAEAGHVAGVAGTSAGAVGFWATSGIVAVGAATACAVG